MIPEEPTSRTRAAEARIVFLGLAGVTWALWILIAAGVTGERDGDSRAWLTCLTFWAPASYLLPLGRRSWARRTLAQTLLIAAALIVAVFEGLSVAAHGGASHAGPGIVDRLPPIVGVAFFYGTLASLFVAPILSLIVFLEGRRREDPGSTRRA